MYNYSSRRLKRWAICPSYFKLLMMKIRYVNTMSQVVFQFFFRRIQAIIADTIRAHAVRKRTEQLCVSIHLATKHSGGKQPWIDIKFKTGFFRRVSRRKAEFDSDVTFRSGDVLPVVLVATKCDQTPNIDKNAIDLFCVNNGFVAWFLTSAKTGLHCALMFCAFIPDPICPGEGVDTAFNCLTSNIMMCQDRWRHDERSYEDIFVENCACG